MAVLEVVIAFTIVFLLVGLQRLLARRWTATPRSGSNPGPSSFRCVWLQHRTPRASFVAFRDRMTGSLTIHPEERRATFQPEAAPALVLDEITAVSIGGRGTDFANTWVEVHFGHVPEQRVAYINDARFLGWAAIFTGSNRRLASALAGLVEPPGHIA